MLFVSFHENDENNSKEHSTSPQPPTFSLSAICRLVCRHTHWGQNTSSTFILKPWSQGCDLTADRCFRCTVATFVRYVSWTHPAVQPVLTHHTLNHLILHLETKPANHRGTHLMNQLEHTWWTGEDHVHVSPGRLGLGMADCRYSKLQRSYGCICSDC